MEKYAKRYGTERGASTAAAMLALFVAVQGTPLHSADRIPASEAGRLKAALVVRCLSFTTLPGGDDEKGGDLCIGVIGDSELFHAFAPTQGRIVAGRRITIVQKTRPDDVPDCHVIVVGAGARRELKPIIEAATHGNILTISDIPGFARKGGVIGLERVADPDGGPRAYRIAVEINMAAANEAGIRFRASLLRLARLIDEEGYR